LHAGSEEQHAIVLAGAIGVVLLVATAIGYVLKLTVARGEPHAVIDNLNLRVNAWWVLTAITGLALAAGRPGAVLLFATASTLALREFLAVAPACRGERRVLLLAMLCAMLQYLMVLLGLPAVFGTFVPLCVLAALAIGRPASSQLACGLLVCVYGLSFVPALFTVEIAGYEGRQAFLALFVIVVVQTSDVSQYVWGKLAGRRSIAPRVSPSKTVEGTVGGILTATALGAGLAWITPFTVAQAALASLGLAVLGFAGGLALSAMKRQWGVKDWGTLVRGHGGVLDRLDSLWLSAPAFYYYVVTCMRG